MAVAGLTSSSWARGPFDEVVCSAPRAATGARSSPASSSGTSRMRAAAHRVHGDDDGAGVGMQRLLATWLRRRPRPTASSACSPRSPLTRNVILPVGGDHVIPLRWVTEYRPGLETPLRLWPKFVTAAPAYSPRGGAGRRREHGRLDHPAEPDTYPIYTGKDVSYTHTKQAQRAAEVACTDGEVLAMVRRGWRWRRTRPSRSTRPGGSWPTALTTTRSPAPRATRSTWTCWPAWREAWERGDVARAAAARHLAGALVQPVSLGTGGDDAAPGSTPCPGRGPGRPGSR